MDYTDTILAYLEGDLSEAERREFEEAIESNKDLKTQYEQYIAVDDALTQLPKEALEAEELRNKIRDTVGLNLEKINSQDRQLLKSDAERVLNGDKRAKPDREPSPAPSRKKPFAMVAGVASIAACLILLIFVLTPSNQDLRIRYVEELNNDLNPEFVSVTMSESIIAENTWDSLVNQYYETNFSAIQEPLSLIPKESQYYYKSRLLLGIIELHNERYEAAIPLLKEAEKEEALQAETDWYLALCYLLKEDKKDGLAYLGRVVARDELHSVEAKRLIHDSE